MFLVKFRSHHELRVLRVATSRHSRDSLAFSAQTCFTELDSLVLKFPFLWSYLPSSATAIFLKVHEIVLLSGFVAKVARVDFFYRVHVQRIQALIG